MEWLLLLLALFGMFFIWNVIKIKPASEDHHVKENDAESSKFLDASHTEHEEFERHHDELDTNRRCVESVLSCRGRLPTETGEGAGSDTSHEVTADDRFLKVLRNIDSFPAEEVFRSLPYAHQISIRKQVKNQAIDRGTSRYRRLEHAEYEQKKRLHELESIRAAIAENDQWFILAKAGKVMVTTESVNLRRAEVERVYSRKKALVEHELPELKLSINNLISQLDVGERIEPLLQARDIEVLLEPFYKEPKHGYFSGDACLACGVPSINLCRCGR